MKKTNNKKILIMGIGVIALVAIIGIFIVNNTRTGDSIYTTPSPEEVVRQYFISWNNKNYPDMYATISDGFKRIDSNTKDLATFRNFASSQGIEGVNIINIEEKSNDGTTSQVDYSVEFTLSDGKKQNFSDKFTLKYRKGDIIPGWKLVHPYGKNIDTL
ncbi:hypothetical protein HYU23_04505 [Candidatus Woesearchaeota archaeon]|nr:hypothetical protein [Candidatus Woesearchaeota archaeon]